VQWRRALHGTFGEKKVKHVSERTLALCSERQYVCKCIVLGSESVLTAWNDVLSKNVSILF